jgi:signal transduction histidine kinase
VIPSGIGRLVRCLRAVLVAAILLPAVVFGAVAWQSYGASLREAQRSAGERARIVEEHALKVFERDDLLIDSIADRLAPIDWQRPDAAAAAASVLRHLQEGRDDIRAITVRDAAGLARARSVAPEAAPDATAPLFGLRRPRALGTLDATIEIAISPEYFTAFFAQVAPDRGHSAIVLDAAGNILARDPPQAATKPFPPTSKLMKAIGAAPQGWFWTASGVDGVERVYAYRKVGQYPFYVDFGLNKSAALAPWRQTMLFYGGLGGASSLLLVLAILFALQRTRREGAAIARLREAEAALHQVQRVETLGQLTSGIAHDFNNVLTTMLGNLELARRRVNDAATGAHLDAALETAHRGARLAARLLAFSRRRPLRPAPVDANQLLLGLADMLRQAVGSRIRVELALADAACPLVADAGMLELAILNLAINARDAMPEGGALRIETALSHVSAAEAPDGLAAGDYVAIAVHDTGTGMAEEVHAKAFEAFFTTKTDGKGTGLGLSQVHGCARQHGGTAIIDSIIGRGTSVRLLLPCATRLSPSEPEPEPAAAALRPSPALSGRAARV